MPDENDIVYSTYQLNIEGVVRWILERILGIYQDPAFYDALAHWWYIFSIISFIVSALLLTGIVYAMIRYSQLSEERTALLKEAEHVYRHTYGTSDENSKWARITTHASSDSPNDWRHAVIEADIMLDELLDSLGYTGASIGDKLKQARPEVFETVQSAWEAHKVRNEIAHRGSDFVLTKRKTQETIAQYQRVFEEFKFI